MPKIGVHRSFSDLPTNSAAGFATVVSELIAGRDFLKIHFKPTGANAVG